MHKVRVAWTRPGGKSIYAQYLPKGPPKSIRDCKDEPQTWLDQGNTVKPRTLSPPTLSGRSEGIPRFQELCLGSVLAQTSSQGLRCYELPRLDPGTGGHVASGTKFESHVCRSYSPAIGSTLSLALQAIVRDCNAFPILMAAISALALTKGSEINWTLWARRPAGRHGHWLKLKSTQN